MADSYRFAVLKFLSHPLRGEALNAGLLVETHSGFEVRATHRLEKLKAISAALDVGDVETELQELPLLLSKFHGAPFDDVEFRGALRSLTCFEFGHQGWFEAGTTQLYHFTLSDLMKRYVDPEPAVVKPVHKRTTQLRQNIRNAFRSEHILARPSEGLESHRVVYRHILSQGVVADFVLQNGAMHVVESVDASSPTISLQRCLYEIAMSALTFEHARINFENRPVKPKLVYNASSEYERALGPSLYAAEHQGAEIINWDSEADRNRFLVDLAALAESTDETKSTPTLFHASSLPSRKLN